LNDLKDKKEEEDEIDKKNISIQPITYPNLKLNRVKLL
jgi:hypothetical protein